MLGIAMSWMTEIIHMIDIKHFVDEQRIGPYFLWHHQHKTETIDGGVLMTDIVTYQPPFGFLGAIAKGLCIKKHLHRIFDCRKTDLEKRFGKFAL